MAAYLTPILNGFKTAITTNINTKKDAIDSTLDDVSSDFVTTFQHASMPEAFPAIEIFPFGGSTVESDQQNVNVTITWIIATRITVTGDTEIAAGQALDVYMTALMQSVISGVSQAWDVDGTTDLIRLTSIEFPAEGEFDTIYKQGALLWEADKDEDPTS